MGRFSALAVVVCCAGLQAQVTIVDNAGFRAQQPLAPGAWAAAFGNFTGVATTTAPGFPLPKTLGGVVVTIEGIDAPLYDVRTGQLSFLIPYGVNPGLRQVQVRTASGRLNGTVRVIAASPAIFTQDTATPPKGAVRNQDASLNTSDNTARRSQVVSIYGSGTGALSAAVPDGSAAPSTPLVTTTGTPQVFISGVPAQVQFSGLAPGVPGQWQINAVVPERAFIAGRVPVVVFMDGVDSNEVTIFVAP